MGGRGKDFPVAHQHISLHDLLLKSEVSDTLRKSEVLRAQSSTQGTDGAACGTAVGNIAVTYKKCCCCKKFTLPAGTQNTACPICGWIDDAYQNTHSESLHGQNHISLEAARRKYQQAIS